MLIHFSDKFDSSYRFRLVSVSCDPNFTFSIDGHSLTVIEADGQNTDPLTVNSLTIFAGQRYSVVVEANQPVANYCELLSPSLHLSLMLSDDE